MTDPSLPVECGPPAVPVEGQDDDGLSPLDALACDIADALDSPGEGYQITRGRLNVNDVRRVLRLAEPFIAARVRAEVVEEHRADLQHRIEVGAQIEADRRVALAERDEYHRNWQAAERRTAEAVADERQRIAAQIRANEALLNEFAKDGSVAGLIAFLIGEVAAGSVPAATPENCDSAGSDSGAPTRDRTQGAARTVGPVANHRPAGGVAHVPAATPPAEPHEFTEDVADGSMCVCGLPALGHDDVTEADRGRG